MPAEKVAKMSQKMLKNRQEVLQSKQIKKLLAAYKQAIKEGSSK